MSDKCPTKLCQIWKYNCAGTYSVTVTDAASCSDTASVTISQPGAISASIAGTNASCNGCTDGAADLTASGGTSPFSFLWSNGATTEDLTGIGANTYSVTITDSNGCTETDSITITEPPPPTPYCSGTTNLSTPTGSFTDGSAANDYVENSDCKWLIQPAGAQTITLTFSAFATEAGYDSVNVYDGATTAAAVLGQFSGTNIPSPVTSTGGTLLVHFISDYSTNDAGWAASYTITTDIIEPGGPISISIFPNPNQGLFTYSFTTNNTVVFKADMVNVIGEIVWTDAPKNIKGSYSKEADIRNIPAGVYFLKISINEENFVRKILRD